MNKEKLKEVILTEFNSILKEYKYKLYHKSFTEAAEEARKVAEKKVLKLTKKIGQLKLHSVASIDEQDQV
jgi:23S rRNA A1618 N6-methylase RlmF